VKGWIKNYFIVTRGERNGFMVLSVVCLLIIVSSLILRTISGKSKLRIEVEKTYRSFMPVADTLDTIKPDVPSAKKLLPYPVQKLGINTADSTQLTRLRGIGPVLSARIIKFRWMISGYKTADDLSRVYGISDSLVETLIPFIYFDPFLDGARKKIVELNEADSANLVSLSGIGPVLAIRIIKYRNLLGGFADINQLAEVYGVSADVVRQNQSFLKVDTSRLRRININKFVIKRLSFIGQQ